MSSHATSGVLHALFLMLAFMTPVTGVLTDAPSWIDDMRVARLEIERDVVIETGFRNVQPNATFMETGRGGVPGDGEGESDGARAGTVVKSDPPSRERSLRATTQPAIIDDVQGMLAGFADDQLGPDAETALGALDDGGGRDGFGGLGFSGAGGGATCGAYWKSLEDGTVEVVKTRPCEGVRLAGFSSAGLAGGIGREVEPDLGDKDETRVTPTVVAGKPVGCLTDAACPWKEIIGKVIRRHKRELQYCYDTALERQQTRFDAQIDLSFAIEPTGGRAAVDFVSSSGVESFDTCVQKRVSQWVFPDTGMPIRANYPFRFATL